jgi:hypothetical protein
MAQWLENIDQTQSLAHFIGGIFDNRSQLLGYGVGRIKGLLVELGKTIDFIEKFGI